MKKFVMAGLAGTVAGVFATTQIAGPLLAQEAEKQRRRLPAAGSVRRYL